MLSSSSKFGTVGGTPSAESPVSTTAVITALQAAPLPQIMDAASMTFITMVFHALETPSITCSNEEKSPETISTRISYQCPSGGSL